MESDRSGYHRSIRDNTALRNALCRGHVIAFRSSEQGGCPNRWQRCEILRNAPAFARPDHDASGKLLDGTAAVPGVGGQYVKTAEEEEMDRIAGVDDILNSEIWFCRDKGILIERMHDYDRQNFAIEYEEPIPKFEWIVGSQQREICGYQCFSAHAWFRGRSWTAWFCPEIPVDTGPWKFNGLPGVILAVTDSSSHYDWECVAVKGQEPIIYYRVPKKRIGKEQYAQYVKTFTPPRCPYSVMEEM